MKGITNERLMELLGNQATPLTSLYIFLSNEGSAVGVFDEQIKIPLCIQYSACVFK